MSDLIDGGGLDIRNSVKENESERVVLVEESGREMSGTKIGLEGRWRYRRKSGVTCQALVSGEEGAFEDV
jgi:hypothetical protein